MELPFYFLFVLLLGFFGIQVHGQTLINGQLFTKALAIVNAPAINSQLNAGSDINLSVDVSGDGKIQSLVGTGLDTLNVFLISGSLNLNLTVTSGPGFLSGEQGSTVKHLNWPIPRCLPDSSYNLTFYESGSIQGTSYYSITPVILSIRNSSPSGPCSENINSVENQPQVDYPPPVNPLLSTQPVSASNTSPQTKPAESPAPAAAASETQTTTAAASEMQTTTAAASETQTKTGTTPTAVAGVSSESSFVPINSARTFNIPLPPFLFTLYGFCLLAPYF